MIDYETIIIPGENWIFFTVRGGCTVGCTRVFLCRLHCTGVQRGQEQWGWGRDTGEDRREAVARIVWLTAMTQHYVECLLGHFICWRKITKNRVFRSNSHYFWILLLLLWSPLSAQPSVPAWPHCSWDDDGWRRVISEQIFFANAMECVFVVRSRVDVLIIFLAKMLIHEFI